MVSIAAMRSFSIAVQRPDIQILLKGVRRFIAVFTKCNAKKFIRNGAVETFSEPICSGRTDFGATMLNVIERKVQLKGMAETADWRF